VSVHLDSTPVNQPTWNKTLAAQLALMSAAREPKGASGGSMKKVFGLCVLMLSAMLATVHATNNDYQSATVVSVESNPAAAVDTASSDAPLRPETFAYNIGIRLGDVVYQAAYNSAFEDVSPVFAANQTVQVDLKHNTMLVALPGNRTVPMAIAERSHVGKN
jgi:hypothetical protein